MHSFNFLAGLALLSSALASATRSHRPHNHTIIAHTGTPVGSEFVHNNITFYTTAPKHHKTSVAVLYLTDVFGIQLIENRLLVDSFARAGYLTVAPDLFNGNPLPRDINAVGFDSTPFLSAHEPNVTEPIVNTAIKYLREELGVHTIALSGYCFGGRYAFRYLAERTGSERVDLAFGAMPANVTDAEIRGVRGPISLGLAETDSFLPKARRSEMQTFLEDNGFPYTMNLYSGTEHGFAVRGNVSIPQVKFGKEEAFYQALRWFKAWA